MTCSLVPANEKGKKKTLGTNREAELFWPGVGGCAKGGKHSVTLSERRSEKEGEMLQGSQALGS